MPCISIMLFMAVASGPAGLVLAGPVFTVIFKTAHAQIMFGAHERGTVIAKWRPELLSVLKVYFECLSS